MHVPYLDTDFVARVGTYCRVLKLAQVLDQLCCLIVLDTFISKTS